MSQRRAKALRRLAGQKGITLNNPREHIPIDTKTVIGMKKTDQGIVKKFAQVIVSNKDRWMYQQLKREQKNGKANSSTITNA